MQRLDQGLSDLQENVFRNGVTIEQGLDRGVQCAICQGQRQSSSQVSVEAYQEHARVEAPISRLRGGFAKPVSFLRGGFF